MKLRFMGFVLLALYLRRHFIRTLLSLVRFTKGFRTAERERSWSGCLCWFFKQDLQFLYDKRL